jgi:hypothetical protein
VEQHVIFAQQQNTTPMKQIKSMDIFSKCGNSWIFADVLNQSRRPALSETPKENVGSPTRLLIGDKTGPAIIAHTSGSTPDACAGFSPQKKTGKRLLRVDIILFDSSLFEPFHQRRRGVRLNLWLNKTTICWICWWTSAL